MVTMMMMELTQRIRSLEGVDDVLLAQLAKCNPTLLQMELLQTEQAVRMFVHEHAQQPPQHLADLDDDTLAQFANLDPTPMQMSILITAGAVRAFVQLKCGCGGVSYMENAIGRLQEYVHPTLPLYNFISNVEDGMVCECTVDNQTTRGKGTNKRMAKHLAAAAMLQALQSSSS